MGQIILETAANMAVRNSLSDRNDCHIRIGELAREFGVTLRTLRFYEHKGLLKPRRRGTTRLYSEADRSQLKLILLGRKIGFSLRDVKQLLEIYSAGGTSLQQIKAFLQKSEKQMETLATRYSEIEEAVDELTRLIGHMRTKLSCGSIAPQPGHHSAAN